MPLTSVEHIAARLRRRLADELRAEGWLLTEPWRKAVEAVPRHLFIPGIYRPVDTPRETVWEPVTADLVGVTAWLEMIYRNVNLTTQVDNTPADWSDPCTVPGANPTSSSEPGVMVRMLEALDLHDGHQVMEIGTGTGYNAALMCHRLGDDHVTSVEIDPHIAHEARHALLAAGFRPRLVVGDGLDGDDQGAPYDRVLATCAVSHIPPAWAAQCTKGGLILATISGWLLGSGLALLEVTGDGRAHGRFLRDMISFMPARLHARPVLALADETDAGQEVAERTTTLDPSILDDWAPRLVAQLAAPRVVRQSGTYADGRAFHVLGDPTTADFATLDQIDDDTWSVRQGGRRRIWDEIEAAVTAWREAGEPWIDQFTLDITPHRQTVSMGGQHHWQLPTE